ncbi:hypothetical protein K501DRAFT_174159 [Backusella circina FSU 941]|nr:hypothetical protein K501DRAFT_174159 [Backusella circina FSU 941]
MPIAVSFLTGQKQLSIELAEPVVLLRGPPTDPTTQVLRGEVHLLLSKPMTAQQTIVKLVGKSKMSWPEGLGSRGAKVYHEKVILEQSILLDTRMVDQPTLPAGLNRWPFEFLIPNKVVETIEDDLATVQYYITVTVQRSGLGTMNLKTRRNILLLRTLSGSEQTMASNSLPTTSIVVERKTNFCDTTIYIEKSIASSGTQFPISIILTAQRKHVHLEAINVMLIEKRVYQVPEYNVRRAELHDFKLQLVSINNMADTEQMKEAMVPVSSDIPLEQIRRVITTKNAHVPLGTVPFQHKFVFTLPNCLTLNHTTWYKEMNFLHHLKLDIEISTDTNKERQHIFLETPITILDCRLKEDFTTLPTYQQSLSDTAVDTQDEQELLLNKRDGYFICPCYVDYKKKSKDRSGKEVIRQQNASSLSDLPPPDYTTLDSKI